MRRWHSERELMLRRWRQEIAKHEGMVVGPEKGYSQYALAPVPPQDCHIWENKFRGGLCHCYRGPGFLRKSRPFGCSRVRCGLCKFEKYYEPKRRNRKLREAIEYELNAEGVVV